MSNSEIAGEFFARWGLSFETMCDAFKERFAPDCRWDQRPLALTQGLPEAIRFLQRSRRLMGLETIEVELLKIAEVGNAVLCERIDHLRRRDGRIIASAAVAGVLEFREGRIVHWREYYDALDLGRQALLNGLKGALPRF